MLEVLFLGTAPALPETGGDTASLVVNRHILFDAGWSAALRLPRFGIEPTDITHLFFTHFHQDHYLGLPQLLFYRSMKRLSGMRDMLPLTIMGPAGEVERILDLTRAFLQADREPDLFPPVTLVPVNPGDTVSVGTLTMQAARAIHPVPALCYRVTDSETNAVLGLTGDTAYDEGVVAHLSGADLLVAEASSGVGTASPPNPYQHMGALDAARMAQETGAKRLALTHGKAERRMATVEAARTLFPNTFWPADGEEVRVG